MTTAIYLHESVQGCPYLKGEYDYIACVVWESGSRNTTHVCMGLGAGQKKRCGLEEK